MQPGPIFPGLVLMLKAQREKANVPSHQNSPPGQHPLGSIQQAVETCDSGVAEAGDGWGSGGGVHSVLSPQRQTPGEQHKGCSPLGP